MRIGEKMSETISAQQILDENGWTESDISKTNLEYLIDNAINYINLQTGLSISNLSGSAGSKTVSVTKQQAVIIKALTALLVRAYLEKGPDASVAGLNVQALTSDPHFQVFLKFIDDGISRLRGRYFKRT